MTNIRADVTGSAKTDLSVHICAVHVDQTPGGMDFRAHCFDGFLKDAVSRRIRDHQGGHSLAVFADLFLEIGVVELLRQNCHRRPRRPASRPWLRLAGLVPCAEVGIRQYCGRYPHAIDGMPG